MENTLNASIYFHCNQIFCTTMVETVVDTNMHNVTNNVYEDRGKENVMV